MKPSSSMTSKVPSSRMNLLIQQVRSSAQAGTRNDRDRISAMVRIVAMVISFFMIQTPFFFVVLWYNPNESRRSGMCSPAAGVKCTSRSGPRPTRWLSTPAHTEEPLSKVSHVFPPFKRVLPSCRSAKGVCSFLRDDACKIQGAADSLTTLKVRRRPSRDQALN